jgi:putative ABC transport system substrate-binding protein
MVPGILRVAVLRDPRNPATVISLRETETAAARSGIQLQSFEIRSDSEFDGAFSAISNADVDALVALPGLLLTDHAGQLTAFCLARNIPAVFYQSDFTRAGGLISYGQNFDDMLRRAAGYVDKILKGAKPADLPVEQPTKFELVINLKTAKALGLSVPQVLLARADEVIE